MVHIGNYCVLSISRIKNQLAYSMSFQLWSCFIIIYNLQVEMYSWENRNHKYRTKNRSNRTNIKMFCIFAVKWKWGVWVWNNQLNIMHWLLQKPHFYSQLQLCGDQSFVWLFSIPNWFYVLKRVPFQKRGVQSKFLWLLPCFNTLFR